MGEDTNNGSEDMIIVDLMDDLLGLCEDNEVMKDSIREYLRMLPKVIVGIESTDMAEAEDILAPRVEHFKKTFEGGDWSGRIVYTIYCHDVEDELKNIRCWNR